MKFLFRVPLFDFDVYSSDSVEKNWDQVLRAIKNASEDLYQSIHDKRYAELPEKLKQKVFKYLLRGRFRATPFGYFSGVGVGEFETKPKYKLDLNSRHALFNEPLVENQITHWRIALGGIERLGRIYFLCFITKEERWAIVGIPMNPVIKILQTHFHSAENLNFEQFQHWFDQPQESYVKESWDQLIGMGILSPEQTPQKLKAIRSNPVDLVMKNSLSLPLSLETELQTFVQSAGNLFSRAPHPYLQSFKKWFIVEFDDRFVPLPLLLHYPDFVHSEFSTPEVPDREPKPWLEAISPFNPKQEIDLKGKIPHQSISEEIYNIGFVFRSLQTGEILLDHLICNRPFSFFGRFGREPAVFQHQMEVRNKIYQSQEIIYAELIFVETSKISGICHTQALFKHSISPNSTPSKGHINLSELEIGIRNGKLLLYHRTLQKRVLPVVLHPLNGKEISHPLMRLLWEMELDPRYQFNLFRDSAFDGLYFQPRVRWGNILLQAAKWQLNAEEITSQRELTKWLDEQHVPEQVTIGVTDRELLIRRTDAFELDILFRELKRNKRLVLQDPVWLEQSPHHSTRGQVIYPQFVVNLSMPRKEGKWNGFVNSVTGEDKESLYLLLRTSQQEFQDTLRVFFSVELRHYLGQTKIIWYFLLYPEGDRVQIRIRFLEIRKLDRSRLESLVFHQLSLEKLKFELRRHYPEIKKYSPTGYKISEKIFHLESILAIDRGSDSSDNDTDSRILFKELANFWEAYLLNIFPTRGLFQFLKSKYKSFGFPSTEPNPMIEFHQPDVSTAILRESWKLEYSAYLNKLTQPIDVPNERWRIISNHVHMQMNRLFQLERDSIERLLYLELYRRIGRRLYAQDRDSSS